MNQIEINGIGELKKLFESSNIKNILIVCGKSFLQSSLKNDIDYIGVKYTVFNDFSSNPLHSDVKKGIGILSNGDFDAILAIGGGSSIDVAKCIKQDGESILPLIAIPTTAGSGSEATRYIVVYDDRGNKESLGNDKTLPNYVVFVPSVLKSLSIYQKKSTLLDALCQAIESWWSVNRTQESIEYSKKAISLFIKNMDAYVNNDENTFNDIMIASNFSGKAINITATTAAHAMSYKITSLYKIPHGNAVAICLPLIWEKMLNFNDSDVEKILDDIAKYMGFYNSNKAILFLNDLLKRWDMAYPVSNHREEDIDILTESVNLQRLKNNPIILSKTIIKDIYSEVVR